MSSQTLALILYLAALASAIADTIGTQTRVNLHALTLALFIAASIAAHIPLD